MDTSVIRRMTFGALGNLVPILSLCGISPGSLRSPSLFKECMNVPRLCLGCSPPLMPFPQLLHCSLPAAHLPGFAVLCSPSSSGSTISVSRMASLCHPRSTHRWVLHTQASAFVPGWWCVEYPSVSLNFLSLPDSLPCGQSVNGLPDLGRNPLSKLLLQSHCPS